MAERLKHRCRPFRDARAKFRSSRAKSYSFMRRRWLFRIARMRQVSQLFALVFRCPNWLLRTARTRQVLLLPPLVFLRPHLLGCSCMCGTDWFGHSCMLGTTRRS
ncbi:hypothetical protein GUJ93_ZPchr0004g39762 [Zizania palustris]|uniref:Uncharacterized protein n=1 Tax=Zizania palustris TaxID=103762 RepID=A0A8J5S077_ZIZPA|nr:hypothetical protein GUJ93_ZPchr0004g39762 [Zizania palustris]